MDSSPEDSPARPLSRYKEGEDSQPEARLQVIEIGNRRRKARKIARLRKLA
jgi:hypothetical protein